MYINHYPNLFKQGALLNPQCELGGWQKEMPAHFRRKLALQSRPVFWAPQHKILSTAIALQSLAIVAPDLETKQKAKQDAVFFIERLKLLESKGPVPIAPIRDKKLF